VVVGLLDDLDAPIAPKCLPRRQQRHLESDAAMYLGVGSSLECVHLEQLAAPPADPGLPSRSLISPL
jgi:hypothetical protein